MKDTLQTQIHELSEKIMRLKSLIENPIVGKVYVYHKSYAMIERKHFVTKYWKDVRKNDITDIVCDKIKIRDEWFNENQFISYLHDISPQQQKIEKRYKR